MAERIIKTRECDRLGCRRRTGVKLLQVTIETFDPETGLAEDVDKEQGELCPKHQKMLRDYAADIFRNTKEYPDE